MTAMSGHRAASARYKVEDLARLGRFSRRELMERAAAGMTTAIATSWASPLGAMPKKGGRWRLGTTHGSTADSMDPSTNANEGITLIGYTIRNHLTEIDHTGKLVPELAESWSASDDATRWTFQLRKGVEFHNGKTMTAEDVIASINHHRGKSKSAARTILSAVKELKADGKNKVTFTLEGGNFDFPYIVADNHLAIVPAKPDGGVDWRSGIGTGGYMLESFEPGVRMLGKRNPNYWKDGCANFDEVEIITIADTAARTNALTTGEIDAMDRVDLKTLHLFKRLGHIKIEEVPSMTHYTIPMRMDLPPFDNHDVRQALKHAIDREAILQTILRGHGMLGNDHPISPANRYHASDLPQRTYDLDKSKYHLKKAGFTKLDVKLSAADAAFVGAVDAAVLYKEHAARAGINIEVVREPNDGYWSHVWLKKPWCMAYWNGRPTEDWMFSQTYARGADWNESRLDHDRFNQLLVEARVEADDTKRREMYIEMQKIVRNEGGTIVPCFSNYIIASSTKIGHRNKIAGNGDMDGGKAAERWWFN